MTTVKEIRKWPRAVHQFYKCKKCHEQDLYHNDENEEEYGCGQCGAHCIGLKNNFEVDAEEQRALGHLAGVLFPCL